MQYISSHHWNQALDRIEKLHEYSLKQLRIIADYDGMKMSQHFTREECITAILEVEFEVFFVESGETCPICNDEFDPG